MLVKINPALGANTDPRNRMINVMRAIKAVCTANAGTTPTCNVISGPTGTQEANQMITVLANTEAGGWSVDTANGDIGNTYNASCTSVYQLHLYNDTGKSSMPYKCFTYRLNPSYAFSTGQYQQYPSAAVYYGVSNNTVYGNAPYTVYSIGNSATSTLMNDYNNQWTTPTNTNIVSHISSLTNVIVPGHYNLGDFYLASTSDYIIMFQPNNYILYAGTRFTQAWEDAFTDNPPICGFYYTRLNQSHDQMMYTRLLNTSNTSSTAAELIDSKIQATTGATVSTYTNNNSHPYHFVTGMLRSSSAVSGYNTRYTARMHASPNAQGASGNTANSWIAPLFYSCAHVRDAIRQNWNSEFSTSGRWYEGVPYAPVYDSSTQTFQPPAIPITFAYYGGRYTAGGRIKGMFKSLSGSLNYLNQYGAHEQDFSVTVNGNTETYELLHSSPTDWGPANSTYAAFSVIDAFLIRKA
jgi:hypothetical protein